MLPLGKNSAMKPIMENPTGKKTENVIESGVLYAVTTFLKFWFADDRVLFIRRAGLKVAGLTLIDAACVVSSTAISPGASKEDS